MMQSLFASIQAVVSLFSTFLAMISAYVAGLYFFLNRAPLALKFFAYFLLSIGLAFLGAAALIQQRLQEGLFAAWAKLSSPAISVEMVRNPVPISLPLGLSLQEIGIAIAWITALGMYLGLGYMTFLYRWKSSETTDTPAR